MANWTGVVTNVGSTLLARWALGGKLIISGAYAGSGTVAVEALMAQTALVNQKQQMSVIASEPTSGGRKVKLQITAPQTAYGMNQIGLFAKIDGDEQDVLVAIYQNPDAISIPSISESPDFAYSFFALLSISNQGNLELTIDTSALVTQETLEEYVDGYLNMKWTLVLDKDEWTLTDGEYVQTVAAAGMRESFTCMVWLSDEATEAEALDYGFIRNAEAGENEITFYASALPAGDIRVNAKYHESANTILVPTDKSWYMSDATAVKIGLDPDDDPNVDAAFSKVQDNINAETAARTNRNLLDNPWFTVNQRGQSSYSIASSSSGTSQYCIDRWKLATSVNSAITLNITSNGIQIESTFSVGEGGTAFVEPLEGIENGTYTISIKKSDDTIVYKTFNWNGESATDYVQLTNNVRVFMLKFGGKPSLYMNFDAPETLAIKAVKLELGSVSTLANDAAPNYAEELLKCQRYFIRSTNVVQAYKASGNNSFYFTVTFPTTMASAPSIKVTNGKQLVIWDIGVANIPVTSIGIPGTRISPYGAIIFGSLDGSMPTHGRTVLCEEADVSAVTIDFTADL